MDIVGGVDNHALKGYWAAGNAHGTMFGYNTCVLAFIQTDNDRIYDAA